MMVSETCEMYRGYGDRVSMFNCAEKVRDLVFFVCRCTNGLSEGVIVKCFFWSLASIDGSDGY